MEYDGADDPRIAPGAVSPEVERPVRGIARAPGGGAAAEDRPSGAALHAR